MVLLPSLQRTSQTAPDSVENSPRYPQNQVSVFTAQCLLYMVVEVLTGRPMLHTRERLAPRVEYIADKMAVS
jgi:hypothetical protein